MGVFFRILSSLVDHIVSICIYRVYDCLIPYIRATLDSIISKVVHASCIVRQRGTKFFNGIEPHGDGNKMQNRYDTTECRIGIIIGRQKAHALRIMYV